MVTKVGNHIIDKSTERSGMKPKRDPRPTGRNFLGAGRGSDKTGSVERRCAPGYKDSTTAKDRTFSRCNKILTKTPADIWGTVRHTDGEAGGS